LIKNSRSYRCNYRYYFRSEGRRSKVEGRRSRSRSKVTVKVIRLTEINSLTRMCLHISNTEWTLMFVLFT